MPKKLTYQFIKSKFEEEAYTLLSQNYINSGTKLTYICNNNHIHNMTWENFKSGNRCPTCAGQTKPSIEFISSEFYKCNYLLLTSTYKNGKTKLDYECSNGHIHSITWNNFQQGQRCAVCAIERTIGKNNNRWKGGVSKSNLPIYDTYAPQLEKCQPVYKVVQEGLELLGIECTYCKKIFVPSINQVTSRLSSLKNISKGENNFYCTDSCKLACPIFGQKLYSKNQKSYTPSRQDQKQWSSMVKERDNNICQKCGKQNKVMYAHHIIPVTESPIESMDVDNGITYCKSCHKGIHLLPGCTYSELRCK